MSAVHLAAVLLGLHVMAQLRGRGRRDVPKLCHPQNRAAPPVPAVAARSVLLPDGPAQPPPGLPDRRAQPPPEQDFLGPAAGVGGFKLTPAPLQVLTESLTVFADRGRAQGRRGAADEVR